MDLNYDEWFSVCCFFDEFCHFSFHLQWVIKPYGDSVILFLTCKVNALVSNFQPEVIQNKCRWSRERREVRSDTSSKLMPRFCHALLFCLPPHPTPPPWVMHLERPTLSAASCISLPGSSGWQRSCQSCKCTNPQAEVTHASKVIWQPECEERQKYIARQRGKWEEF